MRRAVRVVVACSLPIALLAACGSDSDEDSSATTERTEAEETEDTEAEETEDTEAEETEDTDAPDETDAPPETSGGDVTVPDMPTMPDLPEGEGDGCDVTVTGDVELTFSAPDDQSAISYGAWVPESIREMLGFSDDQFLMNCVSADGPGFSFAGGGETIDGEARPGVPMEPATYTLSADAGLLGGGDPDSIVTLFGGLSLDEDTLFGLSEDGTLTITRFDDERIEGSFVLPMEEQFILDEREPQKITVEGTFSYTNFSEG